jgi:SpoVK/Ycf46/Vps4 family AAA+-type ATPase
MKIKEYKITEAKRIVSKLLTIPERSKEKLNREFHIPILLNGPAGVGKTSMIEEISQDLKLPLINLRLASIAPENVGGIPKPIDDHHFRWLIAEELYRATQEPVLIFFDELNRSSGSVRNAALQMIFERRINDHKLHELTRIVAAINNGEKYYDTSVLEDAILTRFAILNIKADLEEAIEVETSITPETSEFWNSVISDLTEDYERFNSYEPIMPGLSNRNIRFANLIVYFFLDDPDFTDLLRTVLPEEDVKKITAKYDRKRIERILRGEEVEVDLKEVPAILNVIVRRKLTEEEFLNVVRWLARLGEITGKKDAIVAFAKRLGKANEELLFKNIEKVAEMIPYLAETYKEMESIEENFEELNEPDLG